MPETKPAPRSTQPWYAVTNLVYVGGIIRQGDTLPPDVPEHLLTYWHQEGAIAEAPVVVEDVKSEHEAIVPGVHAAPHSHAHEVGDTEHKRKGR